MPQTCSTFAAYICGAFAANVFFICKLLFWRTVLAHTVVAHCSGTQCAPQVCSSCRTLYLHTMCAESMQRTVVAHYSGTQCAPQVCGALLSHTILVCLKFAAHSCRPLRCSAPPPPPTTPTPPSPSHPWFITPTAIFFVPYPQGECEKKCGDGRSVTKNKNLGVGVGKNVGAGGW